MIINYFKKDTKVESSHEELSVTQHEFLHVNNKITTSRFLLLGSLLLLSSLGICNGIDPLNTLQCHRRHYSYKVQQKDPMGGRCWGVIKVMSCWGRCDSNEYADWKFPYKRTHHPVCMHGSTTKRRVILSNCDPGVQPSTRVHIFNEAANCACSICRSSEASCEGLRYRGVRRSQRDINRSSSNSRGLKTKRFSSSKNTPFLDLVDYDNINQDLEVPTTNPNVIYEYLENISPTVLETINGSKPDEIKKSEEALEKQRGKFVGESVADDIDDKQIISDGRFLTFQNTGDLYYVP